MSITMMCHSINTNSKIYKLQERALGLVYKDSQSNLPSRDDAVSIQHQNLPVVATEMYKVEHRLAPDLMNDIFGKKNMSYETRDRPNFSNRTSKYTRYSLETIFFLSLKGWELLPQSITDSGSMNFTKVWNLGSCPCCLCKTYLPEISFVRLFSRRICFVL